MKTFPANFITEKNKPVGASPVWILRCPFASTGTIYLSDQPFTLSTWNGGISTLSWVSGWGSIDENISGSQLAMSQVSDLSLSLINDQNVSPNIDTILWTAANNIETIDCELYLWFIGLDEATNPPQKMWVGNIIDFQKAGETIYHVQLVDQSVKYDKYVGTEINTTDYPSCDPDDRGKLGNICYGPTKRVPCHAIEAGAADPITADLTISTTTIVLSDASEFPAAGAFTIQIDDEQIRISSRTGNTLTVSARGYLTTDPAAHKKGTVAFEVLTEYVYQIANHPVNALGSAFVDDVRQVSGYTLYTGRTGSQHATYPNKAVVAFSVKPTIKKQLNITLDTVMNEGSHVHTSSLRTVLLKLESMVVASGYWEWARNLGNYGYPIDGSFQTYDTATQATTTRFYRRTPFSQIGTPTRIRAVLEDNDYTPPGSASLGIYVGGSSVGSFSWTINPTGRMQRASSWFNIGASWANLNNSCFINLISPAGHMVYEIWLEVEYNPTVPSGPATSVMATVTADSNSSADIVIGKNIVVEVDGYRDDVSGTYTGTPNALISRPDHVIKHFLDTYTDFNIANYSTDAGTFFGANSYAFSILINVKKRAKAWLAYMAWQCRSYFRFAAGSAVLTLRPDSLSSQKTITAAMIRMHDNYRTSTQIQRTPLEEIVNKIKIWYERDWTKSGEESYQSLSETSDATSITRYGEKESPELFYFDFVTSQTMAENVRDFYLARYKDRKKLVELEVFLDNSEIEFADDLTIDPLGSLVVEVQKVNIRPGSGRDNRNDIIKLTLKEY